MPTIQAVIGALILGLAYGLVGWRMKRDKGEQLKLKKLLRTEFMYGGAALIIVFGGGSVTQGSLEAQIAASAWLGAIFDMAWPEGG